MPNINDTKLVITNDTQTKAILFAPYRFTEDGWAVDLTEVSALYHAGQPIVIEDFIGDNCTIGAGGVSKFVVATEYNYFEFDGGEQNNTLSGALYELNLAVNCQ